MVQLLASPSQAYPASLIPSEGAYLGSRVAPRGNESESDALERVEVPDRAHFDIFHSYTEWNTSIPTPTDRWAAQSGRIPMINWRAQRTSGSVASWSSIASGQEDGWISQRADAFQNFGFPVYLVFHHEPEDDQMRSGRRLTTPPLFGMSSMSSAATVSTNVAFVFNLLALPFAPGGFDADAFYPGDAYVDIIGADGYNWAPRATRFLVDVVRPDLPERSTISP